MPTGSRDLLGTMAMDYSDGCTVPQINYKQLNCTLKTSDFCCINYMSMKLLVTMKRGGKDKDS